MSLNNPPGTLFAPLALLLATLLVVPPANAQAPPDPRIKAGELYAAAQKARSQGDHLRALHLYEEAFDILGGECSPGVVMLLVEAADTARQAPVGSTDALLCRALDLLERSGCTGAAEMTRAEANLRADLKRARLSCEVTALPLDRPADLIEVPQPPERISPVPEEAPIRPDPGRGLRITGALILPVGLGAGAAAIYGGVDADAPL